MSSQDVSCLLLPVLLDAPAAVDASVVTSINTVVVPVVLCEDHVVTSAVVVVAVIVAVTGVNVSASSHSPYQLLVDSDSDCPWGNLV